MDAAEAILWTIVLVIVTAIGIKAEPWITDSARPVAKKPVMPKGKP